MKNIFRNWSGAKRFLLIIILLIIAGLIGYGYLVSYPPALFSKLKRNIP